MDFFLLPEEVRQAQVARVMRQGLQTFNHTVNAQQYIDLYERMLERPLIA